MALDWQRSGRDWPHRDASHFERAAGLRWHIQLMTPALPAGAVDPADCSGEAAPLPPLVLLIHGTGASTHSWRALMPLLARRCSVVAVDLPGHGFTDTPAGGAFSRQFSLPGMAEALVCLLRTPLLASLLPPAPVTTPDAAPAGPALVIGHSAGAAIAVRMCLDGDIAPHAVVSLNGAFLPLGGIAGPLLSPIAKLAAVLPFVPQLFAWRASDRDVLRQLVDGTGSALDADGVAYYAKLAGNPGHVAGALAMMANWDLEPLARDLPRLATPLALMVGSRDRTIAPEQAQRVHARLATAAAPAIVTFDGLGHLAHEEQPARIADAVWQVARDVGLWPGAVDAGSEAVNESSASEQAAQMRPI